MSSKRSSLIHATLNSISFIPRQVWKNPEFYFHTAALHCKFLNADVHVYLLTRNTSKNADVFKRPCAWDTKCNVILCNNTCSGTVVLPIFVKNMGNNWTKHWSEMPLTDQNSACNNMWFNDRSNFPARINVVPEKKRNIAKILTKFTCFTDSKLQLKGVLLNLWFVCWTFVHNLGLKNETHKLYEKYEYWVCWYNCVELCVLEFSCASCYGNRTNTFSINFTA